MLFRGWTDLYALYISDLKRGGERIRFFDEYGVRGRVLRIS